MKLELSNELVARICERIEDDELYGAIVAAQAGEYVEDCCIESWHQFWPVIDTDLRLTGDYTDGETRYHKGEAQRGAVCYSNYNEEAMIDTEEARKAGWIIDDGESYAYPSSEEALHQ